MASHIQVGHIAGKGRIEEAKKLCDRFGRCKGPTGHPKCIDPRFLGQGSTRAPLGVNGSEIDFVVMDKQTFGLAIKFTINTLNEDRSIWCSIGSPKYAIPKV